MNKVFKVLKVTVPSDVFIIELSREEFERLASKEDYSPIFENNEGFFYVDYETRMMFCCSKTAKKEAR